MHNSGNSNSSASASSDLKNENVTSSPTTTIPTPSMNYNQDLYSKRVPGSMHENLTSNNANSSVPQQHDMKMNSTWNPYSDLNHTM